MPEISEGEYKPGTVVVDQDGRVGEVHYLTVKENTVKGRLYHCLGGIGEEWHKYLISANSPIRVRVSRECYAESLVVLARECGFEVGGLFYKNDIEFDDNPWPQYLYLKPEKMKVKCVYWDDHDLTYRDDLPQIEGWLEANSESEDECKKCRIVQKKRKEGEPIYCAEHDPAINTNCIDEYEGYDEPKRREKPDDIRTIRWRRTPDEVKDYIDDLESELQDVRKELFHKESYIQRLRERLNNARRALRSNQERIEEAREYIENNDIPILSYNKHELLEILSEDSDEGDGECG